MFTIDFEKRGDKSLRECIFDAIRAQILDGTLTKEQKLPSKRALASHLGVSVISVANAYGDLIDAGYLYSVEKKGFFVEDVSLLHASDEKIKSKKDAKSQFLQKEESKKQEYFADFTSNAPSYEKFPFSLWSKTMRKVLASPHEELLKQSSSKGVWFLREQIASYLERFRNLSVSPHNIIIGAGSDYLYGIIVKLFGQNLLYGVENPGYKKTCAVLRLNGAKVVPIPLDDDGIQIDFLYKSGAQVVHVSPSHHFPTGTVTQAKRRHELIKWANSIVTSIDEHGKCQNNFAQKNCKEYRHYLIEDEYDSEFRFNAKPIPTLMSSQSEHIIYLNTFSKTLSPSYRMSYLVLPDALLNLYEKKCGILSNPVSVLEQYALANFMAEGYYEKHLIRMKNYYRSIRDALICAMQESEFEKYASICEENAGLHFLLKWKEKADGKALKNAFLAQSINCSLIEEFYYEPFVQEKPCFVINYSSIKKERIQEIVRRMAYVAQNTRT